MSKLYLNICPICGKESKRVLMHISSSKVCKEAFGAERLKEVLEKSKQKNVQKRVSQRREKRKAENQTEYRDEMNIFLR